METGNEAQYNTHRKELCRERIGRDSYRTMKLELTEHQTAVLRPLVRDGEGLFKPQVVIAQVMPGDWKAPGKLWLVYSTVAKDTAKKIRKLIEKDHAQKTDSS